MKRNKENNFMKQINSPANNNTEKWEQSYYTYQDLLAKYQAKNKPLNILEIGIENGFPLEFWGKYLPEGSQVFGVDSDSKYKEIKSDETLHHYVGNAATQEFWDENMQNVSFDIIIDYGSDVCQNVIDTFKTLFLKKLNMGGIYIVEDLHTSYWKSHKGGYKDKNSSIEYFKKFVDSLNVNYIPMRKYLEADKLDNLIAYLDNQGQLGMLMEIQPKLNEIRELSTYNEHIKKVSFYDSICAIEKHSIKLEDSFNNLPQNKRHKSCENEELSFKEEEKVEEKIVVQQKVQPQKASEQTIPDNEYEKQLNEFWENTPFTEHELSPNGLNIGFIIPAVYGKSAGGHRNIFRAVRQLRNFGHKLTIYIPQTNSITEQKHLINTAFYDLRDVDIVNFEGNFKEHDVCFATLWSTVYIMLSQRNKIKQMLYFVQDYEPMFYPMSSEHILAENTYKMGIPCITSGYWPTKILREKYNAVADHFLFPLDQSTYNQNIARTKANKNIIFFARPEMGRRCYMLGHAALSIVKNKRPDIEIIFYGSQHVQKDQVGYDVTLAGILPTIKDLANLYRNADLGIAFSTTNPSLIPYEMMACGLAVADIDIDDTEFKYGSKDNLFLLNSLPEMMAEQIIDIIDNDDLRHQKALNGLEYVKGNFTDEESMGRRVEELIKQNFMVHSK